MIRKGGYQPDRENPPNKQVPRANRRIPHDISPEPIRLTEEGSSNFVEAINNPPEPNENLKRLARESKLSRTPLDKLRQLQKEVPSAWHDEVQESPIDYPICKLCSEPVKKNAAFYETFERMHWVCFHLVYEHQGDKDVPCKDPSCFLKENE